MLHLPGADAMPFDVVLPPPAAEVHAVLAQFADQRGVPRLLRLTHGVAGADGSSLVRYHRGMRYPQGGGLTAERQQFREELRLRAADRFARGEASSVIAKDLRVSVRSVQRWRQMRDEGGPRALRSQGSASLPRLSKSPRPMSTSTIRTWVSHMIDRINPRACAGPALRCLSPGPGLAAELYSRRHRGIVAARRRM
ncbi:helix-turn-helix domain-containing protein [Streptomyces sp. NPDC006172]|uniref:helix-turn-helix domain-containing protein n=1 Tax=Streptomyces sp. NPDC006172 TaxID=3154470 RepID=UPI0033EED97F